MGRTMLGQVGRCVQGCLMGSQFIIGKDRETVTKPRSPWAGAQRDEPNGLSRTGVPSENYIRA